MAFTIDTFTCQTHQEGVSNLAIGSHLDRPLRYTALIALFRFAERQGEGRLTGGLTSPSSLVSLAHFAYHLQQPRLWSWRKWTSTSSIILSGLSSRAYPLRPILARLSSQAHPRAPILSGSSSRAYPRTPLALRDISATPQHREITRSIVNG